MSRSSDSALAVAAKFAGGAAAAALVVFFVRACLDATAPSGESLPPLTDACDLGAGPCEVAAGPGRVTLSVGPRPIPLVAPLAVEARFRGVEVAAATVSFRSTDMSMPPTDVTLAPVDGAPGAFAGTASLPFCVTEKMHWIAIATPTSKSGAALEPVVLGFVTDQSPASKAAAEQATHPTATPTTGGATVIDPPVPVSFTLHRQEGELALSSLRGRVVLVYFGYAFCPDVCPTALQALGRSLKRLSDGELAQVQTIFISVDPARDSLEYLKTYPAFFHPSMVGVTGNDEELAAAAKPFGAFYKRQKKSAEDTDYVVDHSSFTYVVDAEGRYVARLPHAADADVTAEAIRRFLPAPASPGAAAEKESP